MKKTILFVAVFLGSLLFKTAYAQDHDRIYREKYLRYKGNHSQEVIRNSHDSRYFADKDHPQDNEWNKENKGKRKNNYHGYGNRNRNRNRNGHGNGNEKNHGHGNRHNN